MRILDNWNEIQSKIKSLTDRKITILAVSKTKPIEMVVEAINSAGISQFGENKIQEAISKFQSIKERNLKFELHHIGPVQTGTLKKLFGIFSFTHGVGSISSLDLLLKQSEKMKLSLGYFLQLNLTKEESKHGFSKEDSIRIIKEIKKYENEYLNFCGLMTMGPANEDPKTTKEVFSTLNKIRNDYCPDKLLSMGMSGDYKIAIEEGSDIIRIGSSIFGSRNQHV